MKLFIWRAVLDEHSSGIAFAMAPDIVAAKEAVIASGLPEFYFVGHGIKTEDDEPVSPEIYHLPKGGFLFGG